MLLDSLYASVARARRRRWHHTPRQRRLGRPVISVGNLRVGGSGKTPTVVCLAAMLERMGERPAILSRGYARQQPSDGVTVVSDGRRLRADVRRAGDEPLMMARRLPSVPVLVSADRYLAGVLAERQFGATVHLLDDGFQHLRLHRDIDVLIVSAEDVADSRTLPTGRLREPLDAASCADAVLVPDATVADAQAFAARLGVPVAFSLVRLAEPARRLDVMSESVLMRADVPVVAVAGIARPERFFGQLVDSGWAVAGTLAFRDHHRFAVHDVARMVQAVHSAGASAVMTTEKDLMRLLPFRPFPVPLGWLPVGVRVEPEPALRDWLRRRLDEVRAQSGSPATGGPR